MEVFDEDILDFYVILLVFICFILVVVPNVKIDSSTLLVNPHFLTNTTVTVTSFSDSAVERPSLAMVLADLGRRLTTAFRDLQGSAPIDEKVNKFPYIHNHNIYISSYSNSM